MYTHISHITQIKPATAFECRICLVGLGARFKERVFVVPKDMFFHHLRSQGANMAWHRPSTALLVCCPAS